MPPPQPVPPSPPPTAARARTGKPDPKYRPQPSRHPRQRHPQRQLPRPMATPAGGRRTGTNQAARPPPSRCCARPSSPPHAITSRPWDVSRCTTCSPKSGWGQSSPKWQMPTPSRYPWASSSPWTQIRASRPLTLRFVPFQRGKGQMLACSAAKSSPTARSTSRPIASTAISRNAATRWRSCGSPTTPPKPPSSSTSSRPRTTSTPSSPTRSPSPR